MADDTIAKIGIDVDVTGAKEAGDQLDDLGKKGKKAEGGLKDAAKGANKTNGPFRAMRGSVQQVSWQLQDVAVQAQMGTSAFTILGQQGPQLASIFGPGGAVFGVLIAFGAIVAGAVYNGLMMTGDAVKRLDKEMDALAGDFDNLTGELRTFTRALVNKEIAENVLLINKLQKEYDSLTAPVQNTIESFGSFTDHSESANKATTELRIKILALQKNNDTLAASVDDTTDSTEDLIEKLQEEANTLGMTNRELALYAIGNDELQAGNIITVNGLYDKIEAYEREVESKKESLKLNEEIAENEIKMGLFFKRESDKKAKEQIKADAKLAKAKAKIAADALKSGDQAQNLMQDIEQANMTELEQLEAQLTAKGGLLVQFLEQDHITLDQYLAMDAELQKTYDLAEIKANDEKNKKILEDDKALAEAKIKIQQEVLAGVSGVIGQLADAAEEGSSEAKALFAIEKAIAIATTVMNAEVAAVAAMAAMPGPPGVLMGNVIRGIGYASAGIIAGTAIAGGRALGGQVRGGESYLVGERGPELLTMGTSGRIATNENLKNAVGGDSGSGVTINQTINVTTGIQSTVRAEIVQLMPQIAQAAKGAVADGRQRGGNFSRAMSGA